MKSFDPSSFDPNQPNAELLLWAYRQGIFPMADPETDRIDWYSPDPRGILPLDGFLVRDSLARFLKRGDFDISSDTDFEAVIRACADPDREGRWINETLIQAYLDLHRQGYAHSMEARRDGVLVGGLYGVHIGAAFFGESMFIYPDKGGTNASKACLVQLVRWMRHQGFELLDTQFWNPHLDQFGCYEIPHEDYLSRLVPAINRPVRWGEYRPLQEEEIQGHPDS
ncbi:MAG: leucyl/phenylalanyl-tRNA--protein transferase [Planctomycetota bacterium]|nr:leucyl/phenylalanyl-tRNA--protein transferase [Planctomycetota bacterium]